jgi:TatD DNase family protein
MTELVDIGVNLTHDSFDADRREVIATAAAAGVGRLIVTGTTVTASVRALELADNCGPGLFATIGIHPHHARECDAASRAQLRRLLDHPRAVAAGECGLDYFRDFSPRAAQRDCFAAQLELAVETKLPVFLHQRDAHEDLLAMLAPLRPELAGGVAHCFTGGPRELRDYLELDLHIGITGWICDERRGESLREAVPLIPLERLLLETDAPYLVPRDLRPQPRGRRNEPRFLPHVLERVAALMALPAETVARATTDNATRLFRLDAGDAS